MGLSFKPKVPQDDLAVWSDDDAADEIRAAWRADIPFKAFGGRMFELGGSVGEGGANARPDVAKIETLMEEFGGHDLSGSEGPTGHPAPGSTGRSAVFSAGTTSSKTASSIRMGRPWPR